MIDKLLHKYNQYRKRQYFQSPLFHTKKKYAFIGLGMHSLNNFYPVLRHFDINLKFICTKNSEWNREISLLFPSCILTHSIEDILTDAEVEGVFVCTSPNAHYSIVDKLLQAGKKVFVEKPPCQRIEELNALINAHPGKTCKVGLQRRYWPGNKFAVPKCKNASSYVYQFNVGSYINGDTFSELFIHPLDYCSMLFGEFHLKSFSIQQKDNGLTIQMHTEHSNGITGLADFSTQHSWNAPTELLVVNTTSEALTIQYPMFVIGKQKPRRFFNIPSERIMEQQTVTREYFSTANFLAPVREINTLVLQGFFSEIENFIALVEKQGTNETDCNDLKGLLSVYKVIEQLRKG